jgi:hypothetical protein
MLRSLFLGNVIATIVIGTNVHIPINDTTTQAAYYMNERYEFGLDGWVAPFDETYEPNHCPQGLICSTHPIYPMSYWDEDTRTVDSRYLDHYRENIYNKPVTKYSMLSPLARDITGYVTDAVIGVLGWTRDTYASAAHPEPLELLTVDTPDTTETIYYFHGLNPLNGLENLQFLAGVSRVMNVRVIKNNDILCNSHLTNMSLSQHLELAHEYVMHDITERNVSKYHLVGDSYGSIRMAVMSRIYTSTFDAATTITWADPLTLNLPYSPTFTRIWGCVLHSCDTVDSVITIMNDRDQYRFLRNNIDMYTWSIDSHMLRRYAGKCYVLIGSRDKYVRLNTSSPIATTTCEFHVTDDGHGGVLTHDINDFVPLAVYPPYQKEGLFGFRQKIVEGFQVIIYKCLRNILP